MWRGYWIQEEWVSWKRLYAVFICAVLNIDSWDCIMNVWGAEVSMSSHRCHCVRASVCVYLSGVSTGGDDVILPWLLAVRSLSVPGSIHVHLVVKTRKHRTDFLLLKKSCVTFHLHRIFRSCTHICMGWKHCQIWENISSGNWTELNTQQFVIHS